jgi:hypothetical protein
VATARGWPGTTPAAGRARNLPAVITCPGEQLDAEPITSDVDALLGDIAAP